MSEDVKLKLLSCSFSLYLSSSYISAHTVADCSFVEQNVNFKVPSKKDQRVTVVNCKDESPWDGYITTLQLKERNKCADTVDVFEYKIYKCTHWYSRVIVEMKSD